MAAESGTDVHHDAPRWLLGLFDATAGDFAEWSEFDAEVERLSIEVGGLSREDLRALVESSTCEIPTTEHRTLHQDASHFVRWGGAGAGGPWPSTAGCTSRCSPASDGDASRHAPQGGRTPALYFRALLTEGGDPRVYLHRA
jgi:hypothetical protein